ncbi:MAG: ornithine cyclodeaminase family protein [bacterium]|nr:ornithine cyclodeaminase family protein [bacterium]
MLYLNESEISSLITMPEVMERVDYAFKAQGNGQAPNQPRRRLFLPKGMLHVMYGALPEDGFIGLKTYTAFPGIGVRFVLLLWDANTAELLAFMEANVLGQLRTGAASGVGARYLAREDSSVAGLIGTGWQARSQLEALCAARPLKTVKIYSRSGEKRQKFVAAMKDKVSAELVPVSSSAEAVKGSDIVCTVTTSPDPVFDGKDLTPGTTVIAAGSNRPTNREIDDETIRRAARGRVVTDSVEGAQIESGDLILAVRGKVLSWGQVIEIGLVANGTVPGRGSAEEINLFLSQGVGIEDVAIAGELYRRAIARGVGKRFETDTVFSKPV